jgi:hypothetical protein
MANDRREDAVTPISSFGVRGALMAAVLVTVAVLSGDRQPASAQSIVCAYGTARYKSCCSESYREKPKLGARARANDIDACMNNRRSQDEPASPKQTTDTTAPPSNVDSGVAGARIRRIDCDSGGCSTGCESDELAISAFCTVGFYPSLLAERSVRCSNGTRTEAPTALFCAKK